LEGKIGFLAKHLTVQLQVGSYIGATDEGGNPNPLRGHFCIQSRDEIQ